MTLRTSLLIVFLGLSLITVGCTNRISVVVDAISSDADNAVGKRYVLTSAMEGVDNKDLFFREFSRYFEYVLQKEGYTKADSKQNADIEIFFGYGISDGITDISTFSWPVYDTVGGESISITETSTDSSGKPTTTTRVIYIPPRITRVGTTFESRTYTTFNRTAILEARKISVDGGSGDALWKILISSVGASNHIREVMPYLAVASAGFIGKNTRKKRVFVVEHDNPLLLELKNTVKK